MENQIDPRKAKRESPIIITATTTKSGPPEYKEESRGKIFWYMVWFMEFK
jgi:hypothetical protein